MLSIAIERNNHACPLFERITNARLESSALPAIDDVRQNNSACFASRSPRPVL